MLLWFKCFNYIRPPSCDQIKLVIFIALLLIFQAAHHEFALNFNPANPYCQGEAPFREAQHTLFPA